MPQIARPTFDPNRRDLEPYSAAPPRWYTGTLVQKVFDPAAATIKWSFREVGITLVQTGTTCRSATFRFSSSYMCRLPGLILLILTVTIAGVGQEYEKWQVWQNGLGIAKMFVFEHSESEANEIRHRWDEIGESLKNSSSPFAGTYIQNGNSGYFFRWSPEKGFVYVYYHEYVVVYSCYGTAITSASEISFILEHETPERKATIPTRWVPALGGKYLVELNKTASFGRFYGGFGEFNGFPRNWFCDCAPFAERVDKTSKMSSAYFVLPKQFQGLARNPISGKTIGIGHRYVSMRPVSENGGELASVTPVVINRGIKDGVKRNMYFFLKEDPEGLHEIVKVLRVGAKTSSGLVIREIDDKREENYPDWNDDSTQPRRLKYSPVRIGLLVSTRLDPL